MSPEDRARECLNARELPMEECDSCLIPLDADNRIISAIRAAVNDALERAVACVDVCAHAAKEHNIVITPDGLRHVSAAIRALKEKP